MDIYFRIQDKGKIYAVRTVLNKNIDELDFEKRCRAVDVNDFLKKFPIETRKILLKQIYRVEELNCMKLSMIGPVILFNEDNGYFVGGCFIGNKYFNDFYTNDKTYEKAINYGYRFYDKEYMNEVIKKGLLMKPTEEYIANLNSNNYNPYVFVRCIANNKDITSDEYRRLKKELYELSKIRNTKDPLEKIDYLRKQ